MLIRHAERPSADKSIRGVTEAGVKKNEELTVRGWQRAGALVRFFAPRDNRFVHPALARPEILFACKAGPEAPSLRPQHSLLPLASLVDAELDRDYSSIAIIMKARKWIMCKKRSRRKARC